MANKKKKGIWTEVICSTLLALANPPRRLRERKELYYKNTGCKEAPSFSAGF